VKKSIILVGPLLTRSGYGEQARFALRALRSRPDLFEVFIKPITWGQTSWIVDDTPERRWIDETIEKTIGYLQQGGQFDMSLQITIPNEFNREVAKTNIGYTAGIETTQPAPIWIQKCNEMDSVIVVSNHSKNVLENTKFEGTDENTGQKIILENQSKITSVNYPTKSYDELPELNLELPTSFNFLTVAQMGPRKNLNSTIKWFLEEFKDEDVGLVVKTNVAKNCLLDRNLCVSNIKNIINQASNGDRKCKVYVLHGNMTDEEMHALYTDQQIHAMIAIPHGEGFGLPIFEAAYSGLPIISVGWSGQCDYLYDQETPSIAHFYEVGFDIAPVPQEAVWEGVIVKESGWANAREQSTKEQMRNCYNDIINNTEGSIASNTLNRAQQLQEQFSADNMYEQFVNAVYDFNSIKKREEEVENLLNDLL
jgi:glycosyltransferase involved in cell wall biosynthesis|tara:strand:+ start:3264 stop:4535 length:1272 start_codon:yes stop_codon:yes gene_type:complete